MTKGRHSLVIGFGLALAALIGADGAPPAAAATYSKRMQAEMGDDLAHALAHQKYFSVAYTACLGASGGVTSEMRDCAYTEHARLDRVMNAAYRKKLAALPPGHASQLRQSQRRWLHVRPTYCNRVFRTGGTVDLLNYDACFLYTTIERTLFIRRFR